MQLIRTVSEIKTKIIIPVQTTVILYKSISQKAKELHKLGMSFEAIAKTFKVSKKTVRRACRYDS